MAKIIGFREDFKRESVIFGEGQCYEITDEIKEKYIINKECQD